MGIIMKRTKGFITISVFVCLILLTALVPVAAASGTESRISFSADPGCVNSFPSGDTGWIVWVEDCGGVSSIIVYNYSSGVQTTLPKAHLNGRYPSIRGNRIVHVEDDVPGSEYVYYTDLTGFPFTPHQIPLAPSDKYNPAVHGDKVVWQEMDPIAFTYDIMLYDISSDTLYNLTPDTAATDQTFPSIYGDRVAWLDMRSGDRDIYFNDTSDWSLHSIPVITPGIWYNKPRIYQDSIVSYDDSNEIYLSDLTTNIQITSDGNSKLTPSLVPPLIVWKESADSGFTYDVVLYNTATLVKEMVTSTASVDLDPDNTPVSITPDSRIFWVDTRTGGFDIYMFSNGISTDCPAVQYSADITEGNAPLTVMFSDTSTNSPTHWYWDFGDGSTATTKHVSHTFASNGVYPVKLTVGTPYCRNMTPDSMVTSISVGVPSVDFSANTTMGIAPFPVAFTGTGTNVPISWAWTFGDGGTAVVQNPVYTYNDPGIYTVSLVATNAVGAGTKTRSAYITALNGTVKTAVLPIPGISVAGTPQNLTFDKGMVPSFSLSGDKKTLSAYPPASYGWQNITFLSSNAAGFNEDAHTISGILSTVIFQTKDLSPTTFSSRVGDNLNPNIRMQYGSYANSGSLTTQVWEGASPTDNPVFGDIARLSGYSAISRDVAYTITVSGSGFSTPSNVRVNMSAGSNWVTGSSDIESERLRTIVIADGYNSQGDFIGTVLPVTFAGNDTMNHIEYFYADVPSQYSYLNKFALAKLSGSGNPFQLITLSVANYVSPQSGAQDNTGSDDSSAYGGAGAGTGKAVAPATVQNVNPPKALAPADPGKTEKIYSNANGVISQATVLQSTDQLAQISIGVGVVAKDRSGAPLSSVTITALPEESLPPVPSSASYTFAGIAYNLEPDGATFSPAVTLSFSFPPDAQWGQEYTVKTFDQQSGAWQDVPTTTDDNTGKINAQVSHFSAYALFAKSSAPTTTSTVRPPITQVTLKAPSAPAPTAISNFIGMMWWIVNLMAKNFILIIGIIILAAAIFLYGRKRRRDKWMYRL